MIAIAFMLAACCLLAGTVIARTAGRIGRRTLFALVAASNGIVTVASVVLHNQVNASINAASAAMALYFWWHDGGGDDTKRRLRKWARKFRGVRRTAPAAGVA